MKGLIKQPRICQTASVTFLNGIEIGNSYFKSSKRDFVDTTSLQISWYRNRDSGSGVKDLRS